MRISRYGGRPFHSGGGGSSERSARFRKKYSVGQVLQGTLIKWEKSRLGWVQIDDLRLLASILTTPSPGDILTFLVQQLYPDIILKEVGQDDFNAQEAYISPADVTRHFVSSRSAFQSRASSLFKVIAGHKGLSSGERLAMLLRLLEDEPETAALFFETQKCAADLNSVLKSSRLFYMPWMIPVGINQEIVLKIKEPDNPENSFYELLFALDLPPSVPVRFRIMYKKPQCGFKLLADDPNLSTLLSVNYKHAFDEFLGVERIPARSSGGFLSELLSG